MPLPPSRYYTRYFRRPRAWLSVLAPLAAAPVCDPASSLGAQFTVGGNYRYRSVLEVDSATVRWQDSIMVVRAGDRMQTLHHGEVVSNEARDDFQRESPGVTVSLSVGSALQRGVWRVQRADAPIGSVASVVDSAFRRKSFPGFLWCDVDGSKGSKAQVPTCSGPAADTLIRDAAAMVRLAAALRTDAAVGSRWGDTTTQSLPSSETQSFGLSARVTEVWHRPASDTLLGELRSVVFRPKSAEHSHPEIEGELVIRVVIILDGRQEIAAMSMEKSARDRFVNPGYETESVWRTRSWLTRE